MTDCRGHFARQGFFHVAAIEQPRQVVADALLLEADIQVLVRHVLAERCRDDTHLGMPIVHRFVIRERIRLHRQDTEMFLDSFDRGAERNAVRMVMQMGAATGQVRIRVVRDDDIARIETGTFRRTDDIVANHIVTEGEHLVQVGLRSGIHVENSRGVREKFREKFFQGLDHLGNRTVLQKATRILAPGFQRETDADCNFLNLLEGFLCRNRALRKRHIFGFRFGFLVRGHSCRKVKPFALDGVERFGKLDFGVFDLLAANGEQDESEDHAPRPDKEELSADRETRLGNEIRNDDPGNECNQPKEIRNHTHVHKCS